MQQTRLVETDAQFQTVGVDIVDTTGSDINSYIPHPIIKQRDPKNTSTFVNNMSLPVHRWFRFPAGFSAEWVEAVIKLHSDGRTLTILDPFAGSGTVLLAAEKTGNKGIGIEAHPFLIKIAKSKLAWRTDVKRFMDFASSVLRTAATMKANAEYPPLIRKCFDSTTLNKLTAFRKVLNEKGDTTPEYQLTWLALISILRQTSHAGTAPWQYVLPKKIKKNPIEPFAAFRNKIEIMAKDMLKLQSGKISPRAILYAEDARSCKGIPAQTVDLVVTSPPYANNYDYADALRLEMSFNGDIANWGELHEKIRKYLVCSCSQHATNLSEDWQAIVDDKLLAPIQEELFQACIKLQNERLKHGGKKTYDKMIAHYFYDMAKVWVELRRVCKSNSTVCFVIGDSAPYGIHIPVEKWLAKLALSAGFKDFKFEKIRDRNIKWKNRIHKVPLCEGRLWVNG